MIIRATILKVCFLLVMTLYLTGCLPEPLDVEGVRKMPVRMVVSSQMLADQGVVIHLTKTISALDTIDDSDPEELIRQLAVNDALVTVESDAGVDTLEFLGSGIYSININLLSGKTYRLNVNSTTMGKVTATANVKQPVLFRTIDANAAISGRDTSTTIPFSFNDLPGGNWYMVNAQKLILESQPEALVNPWITSLFIEEGDLTGPVYNDTLTLPYRRFSPGDTVMVSLTNISGEYYRFLKLRGDARYGLLDFLGEPVNYPGNVEGGYGFFNLHLPDVRLYVIRENGAGILFWE